MPTTDDAPVSPNDIRYELADITLAGTAPYFVVHALDGNGHRSAWIMEGKLRDTDLQVTPHVWVVDAIQAITSDEQGHVWAVTTGSDLITNAPKEKRDNWSRIEPHPSLDARAPWYRFHLEFQRSSGIRLEVVDCLKWMGNALLLGTFSRCVYHWEDGPAVLEYDAFASDDQDPEMRAVQLKGGINDIVATAAGTYALGYGGTLLSRDEAGEWNAVTVPWSATESVHVNIIAGTEGPQGELWIVIAGGWVASVQDSVLKITHHLPAEPFGISRFQDEWFVSTLEGCYQVLGAGHSILTKPDLALGKVVDLGSALLAVDSGHDIEGIACAHLWIRTRTADHWITQVIAQP